MHTHTGIMFTSLRLNKIETLKMTFAFFDHNSLTRTRTPQRFLHPTLQFSTGHICNATVIVHLLFQFMFSFRQSHKVIQSLVLKTHKTNINVWPFQFALSIYVESKQSSQTCIVYQLYPVSITQHVTSVANENKM